MDVFYCLNYSFFIGKSQEVGGWIILSLIFREIGWSDMDWIDLAQDRAQWRAHVTLVMNLLVP
jgi:hypothetical protein